ncbi:unnamed protein product [Symbiodinium natans]|uniref:Uncharacterized protein n=1 Tax=Symbiodinium natans TaxID=878477 RepID=A0A812QI95_9DINO|nr:unnamed protein product [Symbiodinium natans]
MSSEEKRLKVSGKGSWKVWTPEAVLRAAFSQPSAALRQVAAEIDGASPSQVQACRRLVSQVILKEQDKGLAQLKGQARALAIEGIKPAFWILNLMFDETELEVNLDKEGPGAWSILASHSQLTVSFPGEHPEVRDFDFIRLPQALPRKTASCMWSALSLETGGLGPGNLFTQAEYPCVLVTCDQATANIKLLKSLHASLPKNCFLLPMLCAQHRNGNVVEQVTKLLGILPGSYCLAKTTSKGKLFSDLKKAVKRLADENPGLRPGSSALIKKFVEFFNGPWSGPTAA